VRDKLEAIIEKHAYLAEQMANPEIYSNQEKFTPIAKEHSAMEKIVSVGKEYISVLDKIVATKRVEIEQARSADISRAFESLRSRIAEGTDVGEDQQIMSVDVGAPLGALY